MTKITGKPNWSGPLKMVIRETIPYRTAELGVSPGYYEGTWNDSDWGINAIMPRYDQPDAIPLGPVSIFISRTDTGAVVAKYDYNPNEWVETSPGVFDLGKAYGARSFVRTQQIVDVANDAAAAAQRVTDAVVDLTSQKQALTATIDQQVSRVEDKLADIAQTMTAIGAIPTRLSGLRATEVDGGYLFDIDLAANTNATIQPAPLGGMLYDIEVM